MKISTSCRAVAVTLVFMLVVVALTFAESDKALDISYDSLAEFSVFNNAVEDFLLGSSDTETIRHRLLEKREAFAQKDDPRIRNYLLGQLYFILAILDEGEDRIDRAIENFDKSLAYGEEAVAVGGFSDGYRLIADAYAHLMKHKGVVYQLTHGMKIKQNAEQAISLDAENIKAHLTLALFLFNAPVIAGGDPQKSVDLLEEIEKKNDLHPLDRYSIRIWLAIGHNHLENTERSDYYLASALQLYPPNRWIDELLEEYDYQ
jgi:tetratricopeptide (TPR) repeat protein